jgi:hypothetical protein
MWINKGTLLVASGYPLSIHPRRNAQMIKIVFAAATAAVVLAAAPVFVGITSAKAQELKVAQGVDVQIGRDRDDRVIRRDRDRDISVGVGPGGVRVGPRRERCRTVTTTVRRDDGTRVKRTEERCG